MARRTKSGSSRVKRKKISESSAGLPDQTESKVAAGTQSETEDAQRKSAAAQPEHKASKSRTDSFERDRGAGSERAKFLRVVTLVTPGLIGLNNLARELNALVDEGLIADWHTEGWHDSKSQLQAIIRFDSETDARSAMSRVERRTGHSATIPDVNGAQRP
jgi:hypothetical protein